RTYFSLLTHMLRRAMLVAPDAGGSASCQASQGRDTLHVAPSTSSTCASVMDRGAPGRGPSSKPSRRFMRNRSRHLQTVAPVMRSRLATSPLLSPSLQPSTMRARIARILTGLRPSGSHGEFLLLLGGYVERFGRATGCHTQVCTAQSIQLISDSRH